MLLSQQDIDMTVDMFIEAQSEQICACRELRPDATPCPASFARRSRQPPVSSLLLPAAAAAEFATPPLFIEHIFISPRRRLLFQLPRRDIR
jgi:hypothetical protein